jgi:hypothetical protein
MLGPTVANQARSGHSRGPKEKCGRDARPTVLASMTVSLSGSARAVRFMRRYVYRKQLDLETLVATRGPNSFHFHG